MDININKTKLDKKRKQNEERQAEGNMGAEKAKEKL